MSDWVAAVIAGAVALIAFMQWRTSHLASLIELSLTDSRAATASLMAPRL